MDKQTYLERINYAGDVSPTAGTLSALQEAHLLAVPFENLDIHAGREIVLELPLLYEKVVTRRRGGFCYELNGMFNWLLRELGFDARMAMGRVYDRATGEYGAPFDHMLNLVECEGQTWIADVGFGEFSMRPLALVLDQPLTDPCGRFLIEKEKDGYLKVSRFSDDEGSYVPQYIFSTVARQLADFTGMCRYHQTSPESHFTQRAVCSIATPTGRITLTDKKLLISENGVKRESPVRNQAEFNELLLRYFRMSV